MRDTSGLWPALLGLTGRGGIAMVGGRVEYCDPDHQGVCP